MSLSAQRFLQTVASYHGTRRCHCGAVIEFNASCCDDCFEAGVVAALERRPLSRPIDTIPPHPVKPMKSQSTKGVSTTPTIPVPEHERKLHQLTRSYELELHVLHQRLQAMTADRDFWKRLYAVVGCGAEPNSEGVFTVKAPADEGAK